MVYDVQRQMLINVICLCILYMRCRKNKYSNNINNEKKERKAPSIIIYYVKIINSPKPTKV